jgi:hypothetical protein
LELWRLLVDQLQDLDVAEPVAEHGQGPSLVKVGTAVIEA